jgi:ribosomal protein L37AE/L43A
MKLPKVWCVLCRPEVGKEKSEMYVAQILVNQFGVIWKCPRCGREIAETNKNVMTELLRDKSIRVMEKAKIIEKQGGGWYGRNN